MACTYRVSLYPCLILTYSLLPPITEYPECQSLCPVVWIGSLHPITRKQGLLPPLWVQGGRVGEVVGGPNSDEATDILVIRVLLWYGWLVSETTSLRIGLYLPLCTAKSQDRKFETNVPKKGIARPQSQFSHSCVCERFIYSQDWSTYFPVAE